MSKRKSYKLQTGETVRDWADFGRFVLPNVTPRSAQILVSLMARYVEEGKGAPDLCADLKRFADTY